jgi:hypothetical protein
MIYRHIPAHFEHWAETNIKLSIFDGGNKIDCIINHVKNIILNISEQKYQKRNNFRKQQFHSLKIA